MNKKIIMGVPLAMMITALTFTVSKTNIKSIEHVQGPQVGNTGAPGELTCAQSGCHNTYAVNTSTGKVSIIVGAGQSTYSPGVTYPVTVKIDYIGRVRFGFQLVALNSSDNTNAGKVTSLDGSTQVQSGLISNSTRNYISHTESGSLSPTSGTIQFTFNWQAPLTDAGNITLYAVGNATNNNNNALFDYIYTTQTSLSPILTSIYNDESSKSSRITFNNPVTETLIINNNILIGSKFQYSLYDANGNLIQILENQVSLSNTNTNVFNLEGLKRGLYLLKYNLGEEWKSEKLILQ